MRISDWSSDVCSSDLRCPSATRQGKIGQRDKLTAFHCRFVRQDPHAGDIGRLPGIWERLATFGQRTDKFMHQDRKSVVSGKSVSERVDLGGRRIIKKKKQ